MNEKKGSCISESRNRGRFAIQSHKYNLSLRNEKETKKRLRFTTNLIMGLPSVFRARFGLGYPFLILRNPYGDGPNGTATSRHPELTI